MILVTTDTIPGREIVDVIGLVRGSAVRCGHVGEDVQAWLKNLVGGEIEEYTRVVAQAREQALDRIADEARARSADAIVGLRFSSTEVAEGAAELLVYGTAVKLAPKKT